MAMTKCKECGAAISTKAEACPQCGAKQPKQTSGCAMIAAILVGLVFVGMLSRGCSDDSSPSTSTTTSSSTANRAPAVPTKAAPPDPAKTLAESKAELIEIESRLKENDNNLRKYYGTVGEIKEASSDLTKLALIQALYEKPTSKEEGVIHSRAVSLTTSVSQQRRAVYASTAEEIFVKNGMDVKVNALGPKKDQLRLKYVLMSKPLVYKFQNEMKLDDQARTLGFKKIIYTDGYDSTWTLDL